MVMKALIFIHGLLLCFASYSQEKEDSATHLFLENKKSLKQVEIMIGDILSYKKVGARGYEKGQVTGFTSSKISFENKRKETASILYKDLESIVIPRSMGRSIGGVTLIVAGAAGIIGGISLTGQNNNGIGGSTLKSSGQGLTIGGLAALVGGIILIQPKHIDLQKSWVVKTTATQQ